MTAQVLRAEDEIVDLDAQLEAEENMIAHLKNSSKAMAEEIKSYEKLKVADREFFHLNIERIKQHGEPPVDQLLFIDPESAKQSQ
jgi:predicted  nucleic acid-binding Zn-ribbon protein